MRDPDSRVRESAVPAVFPLVHEFGEPLTGSRSTERRLRPLMRREGLPPIRFHDLRHTAATLLLTA
jgi:integrase